MWKDSSTALFLNGKRRFWRKVQEFLPRPSQYTGSAPLPGFFQELLQVRLKAEKGDVYGDCVNSLTYETRNSLFSLLEPKTDKRCLVTP